LEEKKVAILDGDLGQSDVGPPSTLSYAYVPRPITDLFNLRARDAYFIGTTSPSQVSSEMIEGLVRLLKEISVSTPDFIIVNTDGWVEEEEGIQHKTQLVKELDPNIVLCLKLEDELESLLKNLENYRTVIVKSPSAIKKRSTEKRRSLRELGYIKYLGNLKVKSIPISWLEIKGDRFIGLDTNHTKRERANKIFRLLEMKPLHLAELQSKICIVIGKRRWISQDKINALEEMTNKKVVVLYKGEEEGLIIALYDSERKWLGLGLLHEIDYKRKVMKISTPVSEKIAMVELGRLKLDDNYKEVPFYM
jgi:polynucleotide 5'-hydroxyl-kinase GRC3/NOL9